MPAPFAPDYASYNWTGSPSNFSLSTDPVLGGDSRECLLYTLVAGCFLSLTQKFIGVENVNKWFQPGDQAYILVASAMVMVMVPGLGFLYSGLARRKSALSMIWACMASMSVISFQWYFWGYSLAFSPTATNGFIGNLHDFGLMATLATPSPGSPLLSDLLYAFYQVRYRVPTISFVRISH